MSEISWDKTHIAKVGTEGVIDENTNKELGSPPIGIKQIMKLRERIEPWLTALFQTEHLNLLIGTGLTTAVCGKADVKSTGMQNPQFTLYRDNIEIHSTISASAAIRGKPNAEDIFRTAIELVRGLEIADHKDVDKLKDEINKHLKTFINGINQCERNFAQQRTNVSGKYTEAEQNAELAFLYLKSFLLSHTARATSRERLQIFTTNYDRFIEYALDDSGVLWLDRFYGTLNPTFRNTRLELDYHYNPPGIRGEPRYVEGVTRLTKLHGSIDWALSGRDIVRMPWRFGECEVVDNPLGKVLIYPNSAKDMETGYYPYAELFRDFSSSVCRPNSVVVTYGYGFGDDHINRVLEDMLRIPSTHLLAIAYNDDDQKFSRFLQRQNKAQFSLLKGPHFADLTNLVDYYLPKPAIDTITMRMMDIKRKRAEIEKRDDDRKSPGDVDEKELRIEDLL